VRIQFLGVVIHYTNDSRLDQTTMSISSIGANENRPSDMTASKKKHFDSAWRGQDDNEKRGKILPSPCGNSYIFFKITFL